VAEIGAVYRALGGRVLTIYLTTLIVGSLGLGVLFDGVLGTTAARTALGHEHGAAWWYVGSAAALLGLLAWFATEDLRRLWNGRRGAPSAGRRVEIPIDGMTCQNCVRRVETALRGTDGVDAVEVTLEPGRAVVSGSLAEARLRETIAAAGYRPL
jgi:copper chaperone CopZ